MAADLATTTKSAAKGNHTQKKTKRRKSRRVSVNASAIKSKQNSSGPKSLERSFVIGAKDRSHSHLHELDLAPVNITTSHFGHSHNSRHHQLNKSVNEGLSNLKKVDEVYHEYSKITDEDELEHYNNAQLKYSDPFVDYFRNLPQELMQPIKKRHKPDNHMQYELMRHIIHFFRYDFRYDKVTTNNRVSKYYDDPDMLLKMHNAFQHMPRKLVERMYN